MKIILLNGPPGSGKDYGARALRASLRHPPHAAIFHEKLSMPIKRAFAGMMGLDIDDDGTVLPHEETKEETIPVLGQSYRQWQIDFSEKLMKPFYGNNIFARLFIDRTLRWAEGAYWTSEHVVLVSDCGFEIEAQAISEAFGKDNVLLFRLYRDGKTFKGDSREYVEPRGRCHFRIVHNNVNENFIPQLESYTRAFLSGDLAQ